MVDSLNLKGKLLVASSAILESNFIHSVVLIVDHDTRGALGLTLNHPLPEGPQSQWHPVSGDRRRRHPLYRGGPVEADHRSILHTSSNLASGDEVVDGVYFETSDDLITDLAQEKMAYRRFAGYAGWATGQLEYELKGNSWSVLDARADLIFHDLGIALWRRCLVEKGGLYRHFARTQKNIMLN